ncbi:MAG: hypothetical protein SynsKO_17670 [Synoicihabitans sp.]
MTMGRQLKIVLLTILGVAAPSGFAAESSAPTIREVIDHLLAQSATGLRAETVDTVKTGDAQQRVSGIVTCFMANTHTVERAIALGANMIITHEPTFYNHLDGVMELEGDETYAHKLRRLNEHGIVVFRFHDHLHQMRPDPILQANVDALGWGEFQDSENPHLSVLPERTVRDLVSELKQAWKIEDPVKVVGDLNTRVSRVGIVPGAYGGKAQIGFTQECNFDALIVGEVHEWETPEYYRDSAAAGRPRALIVTGHAVSESLGMAWLADWLALEFSNVAVQFVATPDPFDFL